MKQVIKFAFVLSMLLSTNNVIGQNRNNDILSDSTKLAEYIYTNMHYPLMDLINNAEGTTVYKYVTDSLTGINEIQIVKSSGSGSLNREGKRLLWQIPSSGNEYSPSEIAIDFKLADNKIYEMFDVLESAPEFPGGNSEMFKFISQNLNWPPEGAEMAIQGSTFCGFVIEKDGSINIVEVVIPLQHWFDAEAMRVIKRMPRWTAGKKDGKPVRVYFILPIKIHTQ